MQKNYFNSWNNKNSVNYYSVHRKKFEDVYDSEKLLFKYLNNGMSILDYGCATGGFYKIIKEKINDFKYTGIDVSKNLIKIAKIKYPKIEFILNDGYNIKFEDKKFDIVFCFGTLHMNLEWKKLLKELWRVTKKYLIFDVRLIKSGDSIEDIKVSYQNLIFEAEDCREQFKVPYIILNKIEFENFLNSEIKDFKMADSIEYYSKVSDTVKSKYKKVLMKSYCLKKC